MEKGILTLADGAKFEGFLAGAPLAAAGTVVFNTAMTGWPEMLTDPAAAGLIIVLTYPLVGNYGVSGVGLESNKVWAAGVVVTDLSPEPSHWNARESLGKWLTEQGVPILTGVDTRALAKHLRDHGSQQGTITGASEKAAPKKYTAETGTTGSGTRKVTLVDCGCAESLISAIEGTVTRVTPDHDFTQDGADLIIIAGGAGEPSDYPEVITNLKKAIKQNTPVEGRNMGHLLLAQAAGAKLTRLKFGHHGSNQPVLKEGTNTALITRQSHLWAVDAASLPDGWVATHRNLNDSSNEGIKHISKPFSSTQF